MLKFFTINQLLDNRIYKSNPQNADFDKLPFDGDKSFIARKRVYCINDDIVFRLNNRINEYNVRRIKV